MAAVKEHPPQRPYIVSSFVPQILLRLHEIDDQVPLGYICEHTALMDRWRDLPIEVFLPRHDFLQAQLVEEVHQHEKQIITWTVNSAQRMRQVAKWGVDGLISDDPQLLFRTLGGDRHRE